MAASTKMTKSERTELRKIVKNRFVVLQRQVTQRENEAAVMIRDQIVAEHQKAMDEAKAELDDWFSRARGLNEEMRAMISRNSEKGITVNGHYPTVNVDSSKFAFIPAGLDDKVRRTLRELKATAGLEQVNLMQMAQDLDEELALTAIESDQALKFLERVPTVDKLLPLPEAKRVKELLSGE